MVISRVTKLPLLIVNGPLPKPPMIVAVPSSGNGSCLVWRSSNRQVDSSIEKLTATIAKGT
jgi:hypothetical protein